MRRAVRWVDLEPPREAGRSPEQLLVEVVADAADRLRDQEGRGGRVEEQRDVGSAAMKDPDAGGGSRRATAVYRVCSTYPVGKMAASHEPVSNASMASSR